MSLAVSQFCLVLMFVLVNSFRSVKYSFFRIYSKWHIMQFISLSIFIGMMWFQIEPTERQISNRQGVVSFNSLFNSGIHYKYSQEMSQLCRVSVYMCI